MWMKHPQVQRIVGRSRLLRRAAIGLASAIESLSLRGPKRGDTLALIRRSKRGRESLLTANESFTLYGIAHAQAALDGDLAEFGVFEGTSASLIAAAAPGRALHLFDSFAGLPEPGADEREVLQRGQFEASLPRVRARLADLDMVRFHPGAFPASATGLDALRFSFVHLDVDLYESTLAGLAFFYRLPAYFACEAALIETIDAVWLIRGQAVGWAPPASSGAMLVSVGWVVALLAAAWVFAGQSGSPARATPTAPIPPRPSAAGRWIDRHFVIVCYVVTLAYAGMKLLFAYWWWFDSTGFWMAAFRPFPDWGTGPALFGAILPARWIGTRNLAYGLFLLFGLWLAVRRGEPRMLAILLLQGALIEGFDGLWLANGKFNWLWTGQNTDFYMRGGFLWVPDLLLVGIYMMTRPVGRRA
ncbi:TylF/MycF/NovP-related O-methyltransferase [Sphingomonas sp. BK481]|uniref:TylF/MycF/NovP-related O-methyltransferase n=1 Tax=Sphingomonas sp. BK481 TaxID=2586981 RepID=UPI001617A88F|nr:TylF/MycF/NovP-related O-methyltransferase [Sphingomonas sp. BK481]MBB3587504.1 hypothetical protein [Sphingomonas sp. BK481]